MFFYNFQDILYWLIIKAEANILPIISSIKQLKETKLQNYDVLKCQSFKLYKMINFQNRAKIFLFVLRAHI